MLEADSKLYNADTRQLVHARQTQFPDGQRIIDISNAAGLNCAILPDRGLDLWTVTYRGIPLTWISPGAPCPADFGRNWLEQFNGGVLVTCGLTHAGKSETDPQTGQERGIHGEYSRLRAQAVSVRHLTEPYAVEVSGTVWETALFGVHLALRRTYRLPFDATVIQITDTVTNHSDVPAPLMLVYHLNFGFPLIREGTEMLTASQVHPRDEAARSDYDRWSIYDAPVPNYAEQVFFHRPVVTDHAAAGLVNEDFGVAIRWDASTLPYLTQWKNTRQTHYVCGIEPGTAIPEGQNAARAADRLTMLEPDETRTFDLEISVLPDEGAITNFRVEVDKLRADGAPVTGYSLDEFEV